MKILFVAAILVLSSGVCRADDDSDIVVGCIMSIGEFGAEMVDICVKENQAVRAEIARYPADMKKIVDLCSRRKEMGWRIVKKCIDDDIAAGPALDAYARDHEQLLEHCQEEFIEDGASRIKMCVESALAAEQARENK